MATEEEIADAQKKLEKEYKQAMESLGDFYVAVEALRNAGIDDDIEGLLKTVENEAQNARNGGVIGSGAKGHTRALKNYRELTEPQS